MKSFLKAACIVGLIIVIYGCWALKMSAFGHELARTKLDDYYVRVDRIPFKFSLATPLYGGHRFSGYIKIRIYSGNIERTAYSVYGDSFYPETAIITQQDDRTIRVRLGNEFDIKCAIRGSDIRWSY
jgi:hypothetical protein